MPFTRPQQTNIRHCTLHHSQTTIPSTMRLPLSPLIAIVSLPCRVVAQSAGPCQRDAQVEGYSSISDMNKDMQTELARIRDGGQPEASYTFRFCPSMVFDGAVEPLQPVLDNAFFPCGSDGSRNNNCIILGGSEQVRIQDSTLAGYTLKMLTFMGLTFADFTGNDATTGASISALANSQTTATFMDVSFTVSVRLHELLCGISLALTLGSSFFFRTSLVIL